MATQNTNENPNWTLNLPPLADITPFDPTRVRPDSGPYKVLVMSVVEYTAKAGTKSMKFSTKITEGRFKDSVVDIYMGFDKLAEAGENIQKKIWKAALLSMNVPPHLLAQPQQLGPNTFAGKPGYILVQNAPEGEKDGNDNRNFIPAEQYATLLAQAQQQAAAAGGGTPKLGTPAGGPPPAFGGGAVPQPQGTLASPGGALAGVGAQVQNGATQLLTLPPTAAVPAAAPAPAGGVSW
jgi:hypothetical protein